MDFYRIAHKQTKEGLEIYPDFTVRQTKDLMVRGKSFYAVWDEEKGLWSRNEYDVARLVDAELRAEAERVGATSIKTMESFNSGSWLKFQHMMKSIGDSYKPLDQNLTFANTEVKQSDYVSRRLPYPLEPGDYSAWDELVGVLYSVDERAKIEWTIGAIVSGDSKKIQKFLVLYGSAGTGKSTILNIVQNLFEGYTASFQASALGKGSSFALESFKNNPLVAIQHDGDLSRIEDNTLLNSLIAHEMMTVNEKYKSMYEARFNAFLLMGTNNPVKISDSRSGIIRRLIDVRPTGVTIPNKHYTSLMQRIDFELGAIAYHCLEVYRSMGKNYYNPYRPKEMMYQTDPFFNFIEHYYDEFKENDGITLKRAYSLYKTWCEEANISRSLAMHQFRTELTNYFDEFHERIKIDQEDYRSYYMGFNAEKFKKQTKDPHTFSLVMDETVSLFDELAADWPAQSAKEDGTPARGWAHVKSTLADIDTSKLHYVQVPENHIIIDFDLKDLNGTKSLERNLEAASAWPPTYAELSQGGNGVHLHYHFDGDVSSLASKYSDGIEVKTLLGDASLRRRLTRCNNVPVATINSGLPVKEKPVITDAQIKSEKGLRDLIHRNLKKEIHPGTKPSIDFIKHILDEAYASGMRYDVSDLRPRIIAFANNSSNQALACLKTTQQMKWASEDVPPAGEEAVVGDDPIAFYDVEVYPNLFVVCWKHHGSPGVTRMINPTPQDVESLFKLKLVGFNNRRYDNHMLWARFMGYSNMDLFKLSQKIVVDNNRGALFGEAYDLSYTDIWDFSSIKQSLKLFGVQLGMHHIELDIPWDRPVPDDMVDKVVEYCVNDVLLTEATFENRAQDYVARQILAELSGLSMNHTTAQHTTRIIFGRDKDYKRDFVYTDLSKEFPGYVFEMGKSTYKGELVGEGGYVYAEPGMYEHVAVLDVASMHPTSIECLNLFGPYTKNYSALKAARLAIKRGDFDAVRSMYDGRLSKYVADPEGAKDLSYALKIVINIVYGLTSSQWDSSFKDPRNIDNIVAKRGALFMIDLKEEVQSWGKQVVHIKTDSIKIPLADADTIKAVTKFGKQYGYEFEFEGEYERFCLINDAVYIARKNGLWEAVGARFAHPVVFKTLFSGEALSFDDYCETRSVQKGAMFLDFEHDRPAVLGSGLHHVGRTGRFVPVANGGAKLYRIHEDKRHAVTGTKDHYWVEADMARGLGLEEIDHGYFQRLIDDARKAIEQFGSFEEFVRP